MRSAAARLALAAAGLSVIGVAGASHAAAGPVGPSKVVVTDPSGDALGLPGGDDIVSVTYTSAGMTTKATKKTKAAYTPKSLMITLEVADAITTDGTVQYDVEGELAGCGGFYLYVAPGAATEALSGSCADDDTVDFAASTYAVSGKTISFTIPLGSVPGAKAGGSVSGLFAYTGAVDPVTGEVGPVLIGANPLDNDEASSDAVYKIG
ncbi:MAG: hypothetical protein JWN77_1498 [Frankiales bacterium]|jgi:hypothetical protein|nr:hypothetical protein [Frankiales bacterium]